MSSKPLLLRHLSGESIGRFPVWMMRQAGRYLPSYRAIRHDHTFWKTVTDSDLAIQLSLLPLEVLPFDAVILFSDILTLPYGLGIPIEMKESVGPVIPNRLSALEDFGVFNEFRPERHTPFVGAALEGLRQKITPQTTLLGFAGAPWTVAVYLVEGKGKGNFEHIKRWLHTDVKALTTALDRLGDATIAYLKYQHQSGAHAVQLFDTWISEMPREFFLKHYLPLLNKIFDALKREGIPTIYFTKRSHHLLDQLKGLSATVLSVDELVPLTEVNQRTGGKFSLQGNLDPILLLTDEETVRRETRKLVAEARKLPQPAIINLGHGVLPPTPVENVRAFVEEAISPWE